MSSWEKFGMDVADAIDGTIGRRDHVEEVRERLASLSGNAERRRRWPIAVAVAAVAASLLIAIGAIWALGGRVEPPNPITYRVAGVNHHGASRAWISASSSETVPIVFTDGSTVELQPSSDARVDSLNAHGARVILERGGAHVVIRHRRNTRWLFDVGPYTVTVTGTTFDVSWTPEADRFELVMEDGTVIVSGPLIGSGTEVLGGEMLRAFPRSGRMEKVMLLDEQGGETAPETPAPVEEGPDDAKISQVERASNNGTSNIPWMKHYDGWSIAANEGRYKEALRIVETHGLDRFLARAGAKDLLSLGDSARRIPNWGQAEKIYRTVHERFGGKRHADRAAFMLGRIAFDVRHDHAGAARWFEPFLRKSEGDPLRREAIGRLMEARGKSGDPAGSRAAASKYLKSYPGGPHASMAREILGLVSEPVPHAHGQQ